VRRRGRGGNTPHQESERESCPPPSATWRGWQLGGGGR